MKAPVRAVCGGCLASVEWDPATVPPVLCPHCGATIDSQLGEADTPTSEYTRGLPLNLAHGEGAKAWSETWSKGSLGTIGRFQLRELLGDGGFGQVFQAYDPRLDRDVALKVLKETQPGARVMERFFREARAAARLKHPNIVAVHDAGRDAGRCWVAYELVQGKTLNRLRDQQKVETETAVQIVRDLADALEHAHRQGVFHRDLKPSNVIIDDQGRPHLTDFGLAKRAGLESDLTRDGAILGTPAYMSPEQAGGRSHLADERSDVYSLGVIFYELLVGRRPADLPSCVPIWRAKAAEPPPPPRSIDPNVPAALDRICVRALASEPAERYPDARALGQALDRWLRGQRPAERYSRTLTGLAAGVAVVLLVLIGLRSGLAGAFRPAPPARPVSPAPKAVTPARSAPDPVPHPAKAVVGAGPVELRVVGIKDSKKFHNLTCSHLSMSMERNQIVFENEDEALAKSFTPCKLYQAPH